MSAWSKSEAQRTIEEVKRRAAIDPQFRTLALSDPATALAKVNPRPVPPGSVRFVQTGDTTAEVLSSELIVAVLPELDMKDDEIAEHDLENVAGGSGTNPPSGGNNPDPPVGTS